MALTDPPPIPAGTIWSTIFGEIAAGLGYVEVLVILLVSAFSYYVWKMTHDMRKTMLIFLVLTVLFGQFGFPSWVSLLVFALISWVGIRTYRQMKGD